MTDFKHYSTLYRLAASRKKHDIGHFALQKQNRSLKGCGQNVDS